MEQHRRGGEDFDYPPMDSAGFSPTPHPALWMGPPPPYEVAIKTTCSSTHLRRAYSDTHLATEPLFGQSREISFEVWLNEDGFSLFLCTGSDDRGAAVCTVVLFFTLGMFMSLFLHAFLKIPSRCSSLRQTLTIMPGPAWEKRGFQPTGSL